MGIVDWHRHQGLGFIAGETKHHALVASATGFDEGFVIFRCFLHSVLIHTARNIRALICQRDEYAAGGAVEAFLAAVIADAVDHLTHEDVDIHVGFRGNFAVSQHESGLNRGFASNPAGFVFLDHGVQDRVADLVAHFIGMTFGYRFGSEKVLG